MAFIVMCEGYLGIKPHFELWRFFFSIFLIKEMDKKYLHSSKWGSIPRYPSHIAMKAVMC